MVKWDSIAVKEGNKTLKNPWAGGLNNPQFSPVDLNGDGIKDLLVFDRSRAIPLPFVNGGDPGQVDYTYAPEFMQKFPASLHSWVLMADYDNDGRADIFTSYRGQSNGITVYRNITTTNGLEFALADTHLTAMDSTVQEFIYVSEWDFPGIADVDGDGDLDILTFDFAGSFMQYFRNMSVENYGNSDSLEFVHEEKCWGNFEEDFAYCSVTLNMSCRQGHGLKGNRHAGSTILPIDLDGDNDKELIIGDIICTNVYMLTNGGDNLYANITANLQAYPSAHIVDIPKFPATFFMDVDNDNVKDFLSAPNALEVSESFSGMWFYKNTGSNAVPVFEHRTDSFLVNDMIEVGEGANPAFFDYNADSQPDLVIGNFGYYQNTHPYVSGLALYKNTGSRDLPSFELVDRDYLGLSALQTEAIYPTFGDLDADGDEDLIIGEVGG
ncbi:MAG: FG-GAP repeat domain-containing protein, partial [Flavobacteriales bacterium]